MDFTHLGIKKFSCDWCGTKFPRKAGVARHKRRACKFRDSMKKEKSDDPDPISSPPSGPPQELPQGSEEAAVAMELVNKFANFPRNPLEKYSREDSGQDVEDA